MKKFILMIAMVSAFFIGLGGIVERIGEKLTARLARQEVFVKSPLMIEKREHFDFETSKIPVIIERTEKNFEREKFEFNVRVPDAPERIVSFPREKSSEPLPAGEEFPRIERKNVIIFKRTAPKE